MNFFFITIIKIHQSKNQDTLDGNKNLKPEYIEYIQKICPPKKKVLYSKVRSKIRNKFNIDFLEIDRILETFIELEIIVKNSDNTLSTEILANRTRKEILDFIQKNPGTYFNKIKTEISLGVNQLLWHLAVLEEYKEIITQNIGKMKVYYKGDISSKKITIRFLYMKENLKRLFILLYNQKNGLDQANISENLNISINTVRFMLKKIKKYDIIKSFKQNNQTFYELTDEARRFLTEIMNS